MFIRKISLDQYKVLEGIDINFEQKANHGVFPVISVNGGGKSTLIQAVFAFLHCAFQENRQQYLKTLLKHFKTSEDKDQLNQIIGFELEHEGQIIQLDFFQCKSGYKELNFDSILELKHLKEKKKNHEQNVEKIKRLGKLHLDLRNSNISESLILREIEPFLESPIDELFKAGNLASRLNVIETLMGRISTSTIPPGEGLILSKSQVTSNLLNQLKKENLQYVFHFNENKDILLYRSNADNETLNEISDRIHLATPNTQVLHFLNDEQLSSLFSNEKYLYSSYEYYINECQKDVTGLFTYEFSAINAVLKVFEKARDEDFEKALENGKYGTKVNEIIEEFNKLLPGKSVIVDKDFKGVTFKATGSNTPLTPKDLSRGELKKLSLYSWLKTIPKDSVVLMDEVEVGFHPSWQHELYDDLQKWGAGNQFILATHSPQIISNAHYKNLVVLKKTETGATVEQFNEAPLESDLNTIVKTIMGSEYIPEELTKLRKKYRTLFENGELETAKAQKIKEQILNYESENSSFFQSIKFEMALR